MKRLLLTMMAFALFAITVSPALAELVDGVGTIRIEPYSDGGYPYPIMLHSPATFNISVQPGGDPTCYPHIFLVMTNTSYQGLADDVTVNWTSDAIPDLVITTWHEETDNSVKVPPGTVEGAAYTVASLRSHLNTTESIYWAFEPFLGAGTFLNRTKREFTVTLPSISPRMLVYALGKIGEYDKSGGVICPSPTAPFDNRVPPTQPGLVIPELAVMFLIASSFGAFALYSLRRKKM